MDASAFRQLAATLPEPMLLLSGEGTILAMNRAAGSQLCVAPPEAEGKPLKEFVVDEPQRVEEFLRRGRGTPERTLGGLILKHDGREPIACRAETGLLSPPSDSYPAVLWLRLLPRENSVDRFAALNRKIEELNREIQRRREAEAAARREEERLRVTLLSIGDAVIVTDGDAAVTAMNPVAESLTRWNTREAIGRPLTEVFEIVNESTREPVDNPALRALRDGVIVGLANHTVLIGRDGRECPIDDSAAPIRSGDEIVGSVLVFRDITERKAADAALRASEARFRQLADALPQIVWSARPDGRIDYFNRRWYEFAGTGDERSGTTPWQDLLHPDDRDFVERSHFDCIQRERQYQFEFRFLDRAAGGYRWFLGRAVPIRDDDGNVTRWFGTCTDIHETKVAEQNSQFLADAGAALAQLNDPDSTLQQIAAIAVPTFADWCVVDVLESDGRPRRVAVMHSDPQRVRLARELYERYPTSADAPHGVGRVLRTREPELVEEIDEALISEQARDREHRRLIAELGPKSFICVPIVTRGQVLGALTFAMAESGRRFSAGDLKVAGELAGRSAVALENARLYRALQEEDRRKDEFLATLAHELRNPLAPIRNGLEVIRMASGDEELTERAREMMERQLGQMVHLIDDLLDLSRISRGKIELRRERLTVNEIVRGAVETCRPMLRQARHQLQLDIPEEPIAGNADRTRLGQVVTNLLNNAVKYTPDGGEIRVSLSSTDREAVISVRDSGIGIPPDMLTKVFDMFTQVDQSLEKAQGGLGLGLTLVKNLVEMHGGSVEARSPGPGGGSEFLVRIPAWLPESRSDENSPRHSGSQEKSQAGSQQRRVLVVDDNADAALSLAVLLKILGNRVRTANDGLAGIEAAEEFRPQLILLDIGMPRLNGYETCRRIRGRSWAKEVVIAALTGWGQAEDRRRSLEAGFDHHLVKPVDPTTIRNLLQEVPVDGTEQ